MDGSLAGGDFGKKILAYFQFHYCPDGRSLRGLVGALSGLSPIQEPTVLKDLPWSCSCSFGLLRVLDSVFGSGVPRADQPCRRRDGIVSGSDRLFA